MEKHELKQRKQALKEARDTFKLFSSVIQRLFDSFARGNHLEFERRITSAKSLITNLEDKHKILVEAERNLL